MFCVKDMLWKLVTDMNPQLEKWYRSHGKRVGLPSFRDRLVQSKAMSKQPLYTLSTLMDQFRLWECISGRTRTNIQSNKCRRIDVQDGHARGHNDEEAECGSWSHLPIDILNLIIGYSFNFNVVDQIRFRAVCKNWQLAKPVQRNTKLPWLLDHQWDSTGDGRVLSSCAFHFPIPSDTHISNTLIDDEEQYNFHGAAICASKHGWLLFQKGEIPFFYNPFTKEVIKLPEMDLTFNRSTFSSVPTSPDCLCFSIGSSKDNAKLCVSICSPRDNKWSTLILDGFEKAVEDVVYSDGDLYCIFTGGVLGVFCVKEKLWELLTDINPHLERNYGNRGSGFRLGLPDFDRLVESDDELLLVHCANSIFHIYSFNWMSQNVLEPMVTLGNLALFVGCTPFVVSAEGSLSHLADRIYFHTRARTGFYNLKTDRSCYSTAYYPWLIDRCCDRTWINYTWI